MSFIDFTKKTVGKIGDVFKETYGPLSKLEKTLDEEFMTYRYPLDVGSNRERYPHTVEFQTWKPSQRKITDMALFQESKKALGIEDSPAKPATPDENGLEEIQVTADYIGTMKVDQNQQYNSRMTDWKRRAIMSDTIVMYMPAGGWMDRVSNAYQQESLTNAMGTAGFAIEAGGSLLEEWRGGNYKNLWTKAKEMINGPEGMEALGRLGAGKVGMDGAVMTSAGLNALGYALNPQFEMLYSGTDLREFQFEFNMTPRNAKEAETIREIIRKFKYHASPAYINGQGRYIIPPSYFDITFKFNGADSRWLPQISTCVLKTFDVDYTGGLEQWATHADGSPIQVKLTMVFAELEMMHKALRERGY